jgi:hypothetical protein
MITVTDEDAFLGAKHEFLGIVWTEVRKTCTTKRFKHAVVWFGFVSKETLKRRGIVNDPSRKAIDQESCSSECLIPKGHRHGSLGKEGEACFDNVSVFPFNGAVLLVGVRARNVVSNTVVVKVFVKATIFASPIRLDAFNFLVEK